MISDIIDSLSSEDDVTKPLLKTLAFARRIGNDELAKWVSNELNGYASKDSLPQYRYAKTTNQAVLSHPHNPYSAQETTLPLSCFNRELQQMLMKLAFNESISGLEAITKTDNKYIGKELPVDLCKFLTDDAQQNGCKILVQSCRQLVNVAEISSIITNVKTKLMELLLEVEKDYPSVNALTADEQTKQQLNTIVNQHIGDIYNINSSGDGNILSTGNENQMEVS